MEDLWNCVKDGMLTVRVTPKASNNRVLVADGVVKIYVTTVPEEGKATAAVIKILAKELGIAKMRVLLVRGAKDRVKAFRILPSVYFANR
jgi:uncharacterized protein YggU (UPF0235/DUF167 family)